LAHTLDVTPAAVSQHLRILRDADLVVACKRGYFVHYRVNETTLAEWNQMTKGLLEPIEEEQSTPGAVGDCADTKIEHREVRSV